jgi:hypothetical protein
MIVDNIDKTLSELDVQVDVNRENEIIKSVKNVIGENWWRKQAKDRSKPKPYASTWMLGNE